MAPARAAGTPPPILFYFLSLPYLLSPPLLSVKCFPAVLGCRRQAYLSCTPRGGEGDLWNMIFPFPFERPTGPPCFKRAERRGADLAPSACIRQIPAAKGSRHISERPLCFSGCAFVPPPGFSGPSGFGTSRSPPPGNWFPAYKMGARQAPVLFFGLYRNAAGESKRAFAFSSEYSEDGIQYQKAAARSGKSPVYGKRSR